MEFEDFLVKVGDFGKYQKLLMMVFLYPVAILMPFFTMNILFMLSVPEHWCHVPELDSFNLTLEERHNLTRPPNDPKCSVYNVNYTEIVQSGFLAVPENSSTIPCQHGWEYDRTNYDSTVATKWNLFCSDGHYVSLILTLYSVGGIIGTPTFGALADRFGRRPTFYATVFVATVSGIGSVLMSSFVGFAILRMMNGMIMPSLYQVPYIIVLEIVGPTRRTSINAIAFFSWSVGLCILPLVAWLSYDWIILGLSTSSVTLLFIGYWKVLPESPRWLLSRGRCEEATKIMTDIAAKNKKKIEKDFLTTELKSYVERTHTEKKKLANQGETSPLVFLKYPKLRRNFLVITLCWIANKSAYFGLLINVPNLYGNEFLNFFLLSIVEMPAYIYAWKLMDIVGRRWFAVWNYALTCLACLAPVMFPEAGVIPSLLGKFFVGASFVTMYQQCSELFPTTVRTLGMGLSVTVTELVTLGLPYIIYLSVYGKYIPFLVFAAGCAMAGVAASFLPETLNENLPQTVQDAEMFSQRQNFFSFYRRRKPSCYEHNSDDVPMREGKPRSPS